MIVAVADTHTAIWYLFSFRRISGRAGVGLKGGASMGGDRLTAPCGHGSVYAGDQKGVTKAQYTLLVSNRASVVMLLPSGGH
jgi:hypothetical protein